MCSVKRPASDVFVFLGVVLGAFVVRLARGSSSRPMAVGTEGVHRVTNLFVDLYGCRTKAGGVVLFDTGIDPRGRAIDRLLATLGATRRDVTHVFLTHGHPDHTAGAALFAGAQIVAGGDDVELIARRASCERAAVRAFTSIVRSPVAEVTMPLHGRARVDVGAGEDVLALPLPGDTPGAYAYLFRGVLFVGDGMVERDGRLSFSPDWATEDAQQNRASIITLPSALEGETVDHVCTAHGNPTTAGRASEALAAIASRARRDQGDSNSR